MGSRRCACRILASDLEHRARWEENLALAFELREHQTPVLNVHVVRLAMPKPICMHSLWACDAARTTRKWYVGVLHAPTL